MRFRLNITLQVTLVFVLFAAALLTGAGVFAYKSGRNALQAATTADLLSTANEKQAALGDWIRERLLDVAVPAGLPHLLDDLADLTTAAPYSPTAHAARDHLVRDLMPRTGPGEAFLMLFVLDPETGMVLAATDPRQEGMFKEDRGYFINGKNGPYVENPYNSLQLRKPTMTVSAPLRSADGRLMGVLAGHVNLDGINAIITRRTGSYQSDDAFLVNKSNLFVSQPRSMTDPVVLRRGIYTEPVKLCLAEQNGAMLTNDYRGVPVIAVYRWMPERQLCLIVNIDQAEAFEPSRAFGQTLAIFGVLALLVASTLAAWLARLGTRSILALQAGAACFGRGEWDIRLPETSRNEIGDLAREFNQMATAISDRTTALHESEERFRSIYAQSPIAIELYDADGRLTDANPACLDLFGITSSGHIKGFQLFDDPNVPEPAKQSVRNGEAVQFEFEFDFDLVKRAKLYDTTRTGRYYLLCLITPWMSARGIPSGYLVHIRDITERKRAEESLQSAKEYAENLIQTANVMIVGLDISGNVNIFNDTAEKISGYTRADLEGKNWFEVLVPKERYPYVWEEFARLTLHGGVPRTLENPILTKAGEERLIAWQNADLRNRGTIVGTISFGIDITERKRAEEKLQRSERNLAEAERLGHTGSWEYDVASNKVDWSENMFRIFDVDPAIPKELVARHFVKNLVHPSDRTHIFSAFQDTLASKQPYDLEYRIVKRDGSIRYIHSLAEIFLDENGKTIRLIGRVEDITERKQAENEMELFRNLINRSSEAIFVNEPQTGRFINLNDRACASLGYHREELLNMGVRDIETTFPDNFSWQEHMYEVKQKGYLLIEGINKKKDGTTFPVETNVSYVTLDDRDYMIALVRDITERKEAEQKLRKSEERLSKAQEMAHIGNWEWNIITNELCWSDEVYRIYGRDPKQFIPTFESVTEAMHPDDLTPFLKAVDASLYENEHFEMDYRLNRPDGTERTAHTVGKVVRDEQGKPLVKLGTVQDITELKKIEEELRHSRELIKSIMDTVDEAFLLIDAGFRIILANNAYSRQAGLPLEAILGKHCYEISHKRHNPCYEAGEECPVRFCFEKGKPFRCTHKHYGKEDEAIYVETKTYPMKDPSGKVITVIEVINDITDKHLLEEQILHTQKMEAVGTLAGGIAHDFNNLLTGILGHANLLTLRSQPNTPIYESARTIERAADRAAELTQQLLGFARRGKNQIQPVDIHGLILDVIRLLGRTIDKSIVISQRLLPGTPMVKGDPGQLQQVLMNLAINARDAMENGGELSFETGIATIDEEYCKTHYVAKQGRYLFISLTDTGCGIPREILSRIFEPFFTTKEPGKGTGMGLAMVYGIINNHGGYIDVYSEEGHGTTFKIYLPLEVDGPGGTEVVQPGEADIYGTGKILVIDDEEIVRSLAEEILIDLGYMVVTAVDGEEGVKIYRKEGGNFHLVVIDMVMPKLGGRDCFLELKKINPNIKAILSTGYGIDGKAQEILDEGVMGFIQKPYRVSQLGQIVREVISKQ